MCGAKGEGVGEGWRTLTGRIGRRARAARTFGPAWVTASAALVGLARATWRTVAGFGLDYKKKKGFINLQLGGHLAHTPWDTLLLALVG